MDFLRFFSLKWTTNFLTGSILALGLIVIGGATYLHYENNELREDWGSFKVSLSERASHLSSLRAHMGYGGLIHNLKYYVLRQEPPLYEQTLSNLIGAKTIIEQYRRLPLSEGEEAALDDIHLTLVRYDNALKTARQLIERSESAQTVDQAIAVDDTVGLRGISVLSASLADELPHQDVKNTKTWAFDAMRAAMGYGGMIHAFGNYLLRHKESDRILALQSIEAAVAALTEYKNQGVNETESLALDDLGSVLNQYREVLSNPSKYDDLSNRTLYVNDGPALRGLLILDKQIKRQIEVASTQVDTTLTFVRWVTDSMIVVTALAALILALLFTYLIRVRILQPINRLGRDMKALCEGDHSRVISKEGLPTEIDTMADAVLDFQKNTIRMVDAEDKLSSTNDELNIQLATMQDLRERADEQIAQALTLAEGMALARSDAEKAVERAEADEQRIRAVVDAVTDAIIVIDAQGVIDSFNYAAELMFGYTSDEAIGRNVKLLMPEPHKTHHDSYLESYLEGKGADVGGKLREFEAVRRNGDVFPIELSVRQMRIHGKTMFAGAIRDITDRKRAEEQIRRMAMTDSLTGLANRNLFNTKLEEAINLAQREKWLVGLMMLDLDKFKPVNDTYGHPAGDALLQQVSVRLKKLSRDTDTVARLGGDEFAIVVVNPESREDAIKPAARIVEELTRPFQVLDHEVKIGTSIGIAFYPDDANSEEDLIKKADLALYEAKEAGRNTYRVYDPTKDDTAAE